MGVPKQPSITGTVTPLDLYQLHPAHTATHTDLDYDKLLQKFGVPENISLSTPRVAPDADVTPRVDGNTAPGESDYNTEETIIVNQPAADAQLDIKSCDRIQCDHGRTCHISAESGNAECVCREHCPKRHNPVCGSDGILYWNHCELHRTGCRENRIIHARNSHKDFCANKKTLPVEVNTTFPPSSTDRSPPICQKTDYATFKEKLLINFYERLVPLVRWEGSAMDKRTVLRDMLDSLDQNGDEVLNQHELQSAGSELNQISEKCHLDDILRNEDVDADRAVSLNELFIAYGLPVDEPMPVHQTWTVIAGNSIEIPCGIHIRRQTSSSETTPVTWERHHIVLNDLENETGIRIGSFGSLYIVHTQLIHAGNYSCSTPARPATVQTHSLRVLLAPEVEVQPRQQFYRLKEKATIKCHAVGIPRPTVRWFKNELAIDSSRTGKISENGSLLILPKVEYKDTGVYSCRAENEAGVSSDISSVFIVDRTKENIHYRKLVLTFYAKGIAIHEPTHCHVRYHIYGNDMIPGTSDYLCGQDGHPCEWGDAVNVMDRYVYASQPLLNRIVAISMDQMLVVQVINTDNIPVRLAYVPHLDQLWVLCWTRVGDTNGKTIQVIRDASNKLLHTAIHPEPLNGKFPTVEDFFIPPVQETANKFTHAYAVSSNVHQLYKIDMKSLRFIKTLDLTPYRCHPKTITYSSFGGLVFLDCVDMVHGTPRGQITMDYLTDAVLFHEESINGMTFISPDSRYWVNLGTDVIRVQEITEDGLVYLYDVVTPLHLADVTFHPSHINHSYDLYAAALTKDKLLTLELGTAKLSTVSGVGMGSGRKFNHWGNPDMRSITSSGIFGPYVAITSKDALFIVNSDTKSVNCQTSSLDNAQKLIWVEYPSSVIYR
ncbi:follistatin-related protein 5-like [Paramacrobiotus metropolitanus]|uniref:follistatin-related protein 5-like n=1 Tax=Paramacrobiotus metropolitanus TaxID=2943436 RepID=UPI002445E44F|nr:follistatin-related protein 5-like [Paramacrobiotus metropolitanus]